MEVTLLPLNVHIKNVLKHHEIEFSIMQLHYLLVVVVVSDVKVMSSTVVVIFAITLLQYLNRTELFLTEPNQTHSEPNKSFFSKTEPKLNQNLKIYSAHL